MTRCLSCGNWLGTSTENGIALIGCYQCNQWERVLPHRLENDPLKGWLTRTCTGCHSPFQYARPDDARCTPNKCADCYVAVGRKGNLRRMSPRTGPINKEAAA